MKSLIDSFSMMSWYSFKSLTHNKLRTALTVLGIVIGIAAIVSLISLSQGLFSYFNEQMSNFGSNNVMVMPGDLSSQITTGPPSGQVSQSRLYEKDVQIISRVIGVDEITPYVYLPTSITFKNQEIKISTMGIDPEVYFGLYPDYYEVESGRKLLSNDKNSIVIGNLIANKVFDSKVSINSVMYFGDDKIPFRVVGILKEKGVLGGEDVDNSVMMNYDSLVDLAGDFIAEKEVNGILFSVADGLNVSEVATEVELDLAASRGVRIENKDFSVMTSDSIMEQMGAVMGLLSLFLGFISSISLVVGAVVVTNTMYMSVMERTREIGTLKAIGATRRSILSLFVIESGIIGLIGGIIGVLIAVIISLIVFLVGFNALIEWWLVLFALAFSFGLGVLAGILPARQAASLDPIEALRYE